MGAKSIPRIFLNQCSSTAPIWFNTFQRPCARSTAVAGLGNPQDWRRRGDPHSASAIERRLSTIAQQVSVRRLLFCGLENHPPVLDLVSDSSSALAFTARCGFSHSSVTALSMMCRSTLLHFSQVNARRSWPSPPGSIAVNVIGESQSMHCGLWFCVSSMSCSSGRTVMRDFRPDIRGVAVDAKSISRLSGCYAAQ
jgi:hypothetical protein